MFSMPLPAPTGVRINLLARPSCVGAGEICLSFLPARTPTACRVVVSEGRDGMARGRYVYDSGRMATTDSTGIIPPGLGGALAAGRLYYAAVSVWYSGEETPLSEPIPFLTETDWCSTEGIWAAADGSAADGSAGETAGSIPDFAFFRHEFSVSGDDLAAADRLYLSVTATSPEPTRQYVFNVSVNGEEVGVGPCRLGRTPAGEVTLRYATYDVTSLVKEGKNALSAVCYTTAEHAFLCQLTAFDGEGKSCILTHTGRDHACWRAMSGDAAFGKDNSIGTHYFLAHACNIDATLYPFGFAEADFSADARWGEPIARGDIRRGRRLVPDATEPMCRHPADGAVSIRALPDSATLIDLGAEIVGGLRLTLTNPTDEPVTVTLDYAEQLSPDGQGVKSPMNTGNRYRETWTLRPGAQTLETLSLMTFRYVRVAGLPAPLSAADVCGLELRKDFSEGDACLVTDHPLLRDLWHLTRHTVRVTTQDIYVDSQSRERGAYEGDLYINMLAAYAHEASYAPARLTTDYLLGHRTWPADYLLAVIYAARADYMATGDSRLLAAWYDTLASNLFTDWMDGTGLVKAPPIPSSSQNAVLVDWPPSERDGYDMAAPYNTVLNALNVRAYEDMAAVADALGCSEDADTFRRLGANLKATMIARLYDAASGRFCDGLSEDGTPSPHMAQHATAYALWAGVYTDAAMADRMAEAVFGDGKLHVSVYAAFFLLDGLYRAGRGDLANRLLLDGDTSDGARTWAYMLRRMGATVTTEAWNETNKPNMTLSHPWGAAPAHLIASGICGLIPTSAGYATVDIRPAFDGIDCLDATLPTIRGGIRMEWRAGELTVTLPPNMTATVRLPDARCTYRVRVVTNEPNILK